MLACRLVGLTAVVDATAEVVGGDRDWKCIECGHEVTNASRPTVCPVCNCRTGDLPSRYHLFFRAEAMEAAPGLVTGFRQFRRREST